MEFIRLFARLFVRLSVDSRLFNRALGYYRTWGLRAATRRAWAETRVALKRRTGALRPDERQLDPGRFESLVAAAGVRLVVFDLFDTLVERPLPVPDLARQVIAARLGDPGFLAARAAAERAARAQAGQRDVTLADIYRHCTLAGPSTTEHRVAKNLAAEHLVELEEATELALCVPRPGAARLLATARRAGKQVALASDTALSRGAVERILANCGLDGIDLLYVSSDIGERKSTGRLFDRILTDSGLRPEQILVVGDHPLSDARIPEQKGMQTYPLPTVPDTAIAFPRAAGRLSGVLRADAGEKRLSATDVVTGLIARRFFSDLFPAVARDRAALVQGGRHGVGYAIVGPLLVAFCEWLGERAQRDGMSRLYFLAREGQLLREVFARVFPGSASSSMPERHYLVLSRRAVAMAMIESWDDVLDVARTAFLPGSLSDYLQRRFGIVLDEDELRRLDAAGVWPVDRKVEVRGGQVAHLHAVLQWLAPRIQEQARRERQALDAYLAASGLFDDGRAAVVDVGYAASTQARLCALGGDRPVHGYYLVTRDVVAGLRQRFGVLADGAYAHDVRTPEDAALLRYCLPLEMLLGSDDPQLTHYRLDDDGVPVAHWQTLSEAEYSCAPMRTEVRAGALAFAEDYRHLKDLLGGGMRIDLGFAERLFSDFWEGISASERQALAAIAGDDHYCGRGVVRFADLFGEA